MKALLSTIGSRGDVQPLVALAVELRANGHDVRLCVPPDFREWIEGLGFPVTPMGPELRKMTAAAPAGAAPPSPEVLRKLAEASVATQFETIAAAADGCDVVVGATALQIAAPSVAEKLGIPYVFAAYCPAVLPSPHHAPLPLTSLGQTPPPAAADNNELWARDAQRGNALWGAVLNANRAALGLAPVDDVRSYVFTARPWLAADPVLAPWPGGDSVFQPGAWILRDDRPLPPELEAFLDDGAPPVYFGFGSMRAPQDLSRVMIDAARALGRRAIVSRGWADLSLAADAPDCIAIDEVNQQALFPRVAAVVHHGGAGTTTAAARAGAPQVIVPQLYDQHYFARRIHDLGIGIAHAPGVPAVESLTVALENAVPLAAGAKAVAGEMRDDGAQRAVEHLAQL